MGFTISPEVRNGIAIVFIIYSLVIVGLGLYVKYASRNQSAAQRLASFLTGNGNLGPIALGMIIFTNLMSSGGMIGGPGLGYNTGFIWSVAVYSSFICTFLTLVAVGKKMNIMSKRTGARTLPQLFMHRYESKLFSVILAVLFIVFLLPYCASQFSGGGKLFATITGAENYTLGVILFAGVTVIYTLSGGISSLAKVAVVQGAVMIVAVITIYVATVMGLVDQYGSFSAAMEFVSTNNPALVSANTWDSLYFFGLLIEMTTIALPNGLSPTFTYKKSSTIVRGVVISTICFSLVQLTMSGLGPLGYALNPNLSSGDYVVPMLLSSVLPPWMGGIVVSGVAAAVQSTVASFLLIISSSIIEDIYQGIRPNTSDVTLNRGNKISTLIAAIIAVIIALYPNENIQLIVNFAIGGICSGFLFPLFFGLYSKRATPRRFGNLGADRGYRCVRHGHRDERQSPVCHSPSGHLGHGQQPGGDAGRYARYKAGASWHTAGVVCKSIRSPLCHVPA